MSLRLYYDLLSPPSRALAIFLNAAKVPYESCPILLRKGAQYSPDYEKINRFKKVPCIDDGGFKLAESVAIMRYLSRAYSVPDHLYPKDTKQQARIDEFLEWQHLGLRNQSGTYFLIKYLLPLMSGSEPVSSRLQHCEFQLDQALDVIENIWLKDTSYLAGDKISIADILGACEVEQAKISGFDITAGRSKSEQWLNAVRGELNPHYEEAHESVNKIYESQKKSEKLAA